MCERLRVLIIFKALNLTLTPAKTKEKIVDTLLLPPSQYLNCNLRLSGPHCLFLPG